MGYSPRGCKTVRHNLVTKQELREFQSQNSIQVSKFPAYDVPLTLAQVNGVVPGFMVVKQAVSTGSQRNWDNPRKHMQ